VVPIADATRMAVAVNSPTERRMGGPDTNRSGRTARRSDPNRACAAGAFQIERAVAHELTGSADVELDRATSEGPATHQTGLRP
jgi:hypothetical protein